MFPFMFNPYFGRRTNFRLLDQVIPKVTTISVSDTDTATTLGICPKVWCQLPREGVMVFEARHTPSSIGLTIATEKSQIVNMVRQSLDDCRIKKESLSKIDEEMRRCEDILKILNVNSDITTNVTKDFKELDDLKAEVKELKQLLQNVSAVRPEVIKNTPPNSTEDKKVEPEGEIKKEI